MEEPKGNERIAVPVRIETPTGQCGAVDGTRIWIDGKEAFCVSRIAVDITAGEIVKVTTYQFAEVVMEGEAEVRQVHLCAGCKAGLEKQKQEVIDGSRAGLSTAETTTISDKWVRRDPVPEGGANASD